MYLVRKRTKMVPEIMTRMIPRGQFKCAICEEWSHKNYKNEEYRSYKPERKIAVCDDCHHDYRNSPEYEHLRPDMRFDEKKEIEKKREYFKDTHIYF